MSTLAEQEIRYTDDSGAAHGMMEQQSALGQLGSAIRRSVVAFAIATILLILAFILMLNRQNALNAIGEQVNLADQFYIETLTMQEAEKDYIITGQETHLVAFNTHFEHAQENITSLLEHAALTEKELDILNRLKSNAQTYRQIFDQAVQKQEMRGFDINQEGSLLHTLETEAQKYYQLLDGLTVAPEIENTLLELRMAIKDYIISESPSIISQVQNTGNELKRAFAISSNDLSASQLRALLETTNEFLELFEKYANLTIETNQEFADTTVAAHASQYLIPRFTDLLLERQAAISQQLFYILLVTAGVLIAIFLLVIYQLRHAQRNADATLNETITAQAKAEAENERLNDSVISILEAVNALSQRDLRARAPVTEDIIGTVSDSINALADETARVLAGVTGIAGHVSQVSDNVKLQALQVSETAEQERESVNRMIESLLETTQVMDQVSALAEQTNESATQATTATNDALQTVTETVEGMDTIRQTISETEKRIKRLGERSQEISGIVNLINTISERTHVLALNASMQAAVAGEAGRGFAVVAQEVQQLAESSRHATDQIATLVNNIQIETNETINTVNRTISQVVEGTEQAQRAGTQMQRTQEITAELVASVASIAEASQQQKTLSAQLLESVQKIGESTERTAQQIAVQNSGTDDLQKAAADLVQSVNVFKLPAPQH